MAARTASVILKYDTWDADETGEIVRLPAAPVEGIDAEGQPVRSRETVISRELAERLVKEGKATVPLK